MGNPIPAPPATISLFLPSLDGGGAERVFVQLANEFAAQGLRTHLVLAAARGPYLEEVAAGVRIVDLGARGVLRALPKLVAYLRSERPQAMLSALDHANLISLLACRIARIHIRCVISMRSVPTAVYREERSALRWLVPALMRRFYPRADRIIANSQAVAGDLTGNFRVPAEKVSVIYNPLDLGLIERRSQEAIEDPWLRRNSSPLILGMGRLDALKDFPTLIRAFALLRSKRQCRLAILGDGAGRHDLERLVGELNLQDDVHLPGFIDNPFAWMRAAAVVVSSSLTEGCPNAVMQALACGTAVVSTNSVGGAAEILEGGRWGGLVPVKDAPAMAASMAASIDDKNRVDLRVRATDFALGGVARAYLQQLIPGLAAPAGRQ